MSKKVSAVDVHGNKYTVDTASLEWRPSVYGIVIKDNKILLSPQFDGHDLPGGGLELGEQMEEGVIREVQEETGLTVKNPKLVDVKVSFFRSFHAENKSYHSILFYYICEHVGGDISTAGFDEYEKEYAQPAQWVLLSEINQLKPAATVDWRPIVKKVSE
jgi:8-oxo-dGTP diphosphatase